MKRRRRKKKQRVVETMYIPRLWDLDGGPALKFYDVYYRGELPPSFMSEGNHCQVPYPRGPSPNFHEVFLQLRELLHRCARYCTLF